MLEAFCSRTFLSVFKQIIVLLLFRKRVQIAEMSVQVDPTVIRAVFGGMSIRKAIKNWTGAVSARIHALT